ncbi:MerR family transcriptional regulator [Pseudoclavibacter sp. RFBJ3]|uniref:MerR family transcriptional regulator n=1 Tax=unclassified Pseudoclavibacter TaxID=2615177 RepID=UPI000CE9376B|nr:MULTISPECIES: MerR family transcriptional regulator [unclassified Pseudoclavibacter]PPF87237.1 MerR family transcriptional regulator [Pseudoclavibacter sp. RFBJ5]PPF89460.1 MerR family transcriptional regulator [Pseudoclavibacter sp. RFBJ3]PPG00735.1 MerR family transcriptional regulator [Pseudoclavibacter sp. RFBH5]PPG18844.1 MerR family transcriptional regulator [Pseudoclavibacter sp. RFBI4]
MTEETMQIGKLADRTGMSIRSLRHYDEIGLLVPSARTEGGFRLYTAEDEERLLLIRRMKPLGYSLEQMRELLDVVDELAAHPGNSANRTRLEEIRSEALERQAKLRQQVAAADEFVERLTALE